MGECAAVLGLPAVFARMTLVRWALAVPLFALPSLDVSAGFAIEVATFTLLAGLTTAAGSYLISERLLRPAFALALRDAPLARHRPAVGAHVAAVLGRPAPPGRVHPDRAGRPRC